MQQSRGECIVYVSPLLKKRATIFNLNEFLDSEKLFPDYFESAQKSKTFKLIIPDSLANRVYFINDSLDIENGIETFYFFSPLLPTKQKNIFAIECYNISTVQADIYTMRFIDRHYDIYFIKKKLKYEKTINANEDFLTYRCVGLRKNSCRPSAARGFAPSSLNPLPPRLCRPSATSVGG